MASAITNGTGVVLASPLELPAQSGEPLTTEGGNTLDDGSGNVIIAGYIRSQPVATTGPAGFTLTSGTVPVTIVQWTCPNDGRLHSAHIVGAYNTSSNQTGGQINWEIVGTPTFDEINLAQGNGWWISGPDWLLQPGQTVALTQSGALTAGSGTVWASIYADL